MYQFRSRLAAQRTTAANLGNGGQIWHALEVIAREISIASLPDLRHRLFDLCAKLFLAVAVLSQLPESKGQLENL